MPIPTATIVVADDALQIGATSLVTITFSEAVSGFSNAGLTIENATKYVVGWDLKESDLLPGGDPEPVVFDRAIFALWLADRADLWEPIVSGVVNAYRAHEDAQEARGNV